MHIAMPRLAAVLLALAAALPAFAETPAQEIHTWPQWRGPARDGFAQGPAWPASLNEKHLTPLWRVPLGPSYSGPLVTPDAVFVTETKDKKTEVVRSLDRATGKEVWSAQWPGSISVPFFAKENGDWIRATPAYDGTSLFVPGIRELLVSLDAKTGKENWRVDFTAEFKTKAPDFGLVCSPLVDDAFLYIQAANSVVKLDKSTGKTVWRVLESKGDMMESGAFSSPVIATLAGKKQLVVQTRDKLAGVDLESGSTLWSQTVPNFRGMNILTPVIFNDSIFTSTYQNKSFLYTVSKEADAFKMTQTWTNPSQGYMSTPVVIDAHAYMHLGNQRFACLDLATGKRTWSSPDLYGKYASLVAQGDRILALDQRGLLLLLKANPAKFEVLDERQITDAETWAHLAVVDNQLFIRELKAMTVYSWTTPAASAAPAEAPAKK